MRGLLSLSLGLAVVAGASLASAQDINQGSSSSSSSSSSSGGGGTSGGSVTDTAGPTDHSVVVGHLGLRYFGATAVSVLAGGGSGLTQYPGSQGAFTVPAPSAMGMGAASSSATLHTVGVRYWLNNALGIEGGLAFGISSGTRSFTRPEGSGTRTDQDDDPGFFGVGFQFGVPLMLAEAKHVNIQLVPFLAFHYASASITRGSTAMDARDESSNSINLALGANAAAEVQLGFLGMPQLSLTGQFGLQLWYRSATLQTVPRATNIPTTISQSTFGLGTSVGPNYSLSDIISGSIAVTYYWGRPG